MTVESSASKVTWLGNGATTVWSFSFEIDDPAFIVLTFTDTLGNVTLLSSAVWSVLGIGNPVGGTITYPLVGSPIAVGTMLTLQRIVPYTQLVNLANQGGLWPTVVMGMDDNLEFQIQQLAEVLARAVVASVSETGPLLPLPPVVARANKLAGFDGNGNPIAVAGIQGGAIVSTAMLAVVSAASVALAVVALGLGANGAGTSGSGEIGYNSGLTGALPTTVAARLAADHINAISDFGMPTDGVSDCQPALRNAVIASIANGGRRIYVPGIPSGHIFNSEVLIDGGTEIYGDGPGTGPGNASTVGGTRLYTTSNANNLFHVNTSQPANLHDLFLGSTVSPGVGSGCGVLIENTGSGGSNGNSRFRRLGIVNLPYGLKFTAAAFYNVLECYFGAWTQACIWVENTINNDSGDNWIAGNKFFGDQNGAQMAHIRIINAPGLFISGNKFLGGQKQIWLSYSGGPTGTIIAEDNSFEQFSVAALFAELDGTQPFGNLQFVINEVSTISPVTPQAAIAIIAGASPWLSNVGINDNVFNMGTMGPVLIDCEDGLQGTIIGNVMNCGSTAGTHAIKVAGNANDWTVAHNRWKSSGAGSKQYDSMAGAVIDNREGVPFADLPSDALNGSLVFVPDGTIGNPLTGSGTGCYAKRVTGIWIGF